MDYRVRGSYARVVYRTQDTSCKGTRRVKQEEEADTGIIIKEYYETWRKGTWTL